MKIVGQKYSYNINFLFPLWKVDSRKEAMRILHPSNTCTNNLCCWNMESIGILAATFQQLMGTSGKDNIPLIWICSFLQMMYYKILTLHFPRADSIFHLQINSKVPSQIITVVDAFHWKYQSHLLKAFQAHL